MENQSIFTSKHLVHRESVSICESNKLERLAIQNNVLLK